MKKLFIALASVFLMLSCSQEEGILPAQEKIDTTSVPSVAQSQLKFAKLLSQAASGSVEVRSFLKKEALEQFDNDYDIFYPLIKNKVVYGDRTFRDILLSYCENENELSQVEQSLLLLNILVPDLTLFGDFNAKSWDVNNKEIAVICRDDETNTLYENGENIGQMSGGDIPAFPCLVVKNNERLKVSSVNTRSGEVTYEFIDDVFDGSKRAPQTRHSDWDDNLEPTQDLTLGVGGSVFKAPITEAWTEFKDVKNACQRDYIYYGITKANKPGTLNRNIREELYRFLIQKDAFSKIADQQGSDPALQETSQGKRYLTNAEILKRIWTDGRFEFRFRTYIASETSSEAMEHMLPISIEAKDVFSIEKVHVHHKNSTMFRQSKNFYSVDANNLRSKWIYTRDHAKSDNSLFLLPWDIYSKSLVMHLFVEESDDSQTIEQTRTVVNEFTNKADFSVEGGGSIDKVKLTAKLGYGFSHTNTNTSSIKLITNVGSDPLGTLSFFYYDPVIKYQTDGAYNLYSVNNGTVEATILPRDITRP